MPIAKSRIGCLFLIAALGCAGCAGDLPESQVVVPRLQLGSVTLSGVMRAYGQPRKKTPVGLWYVGPGAESLTAGRVGWMTFLEFDAAGRLSAQEFLRVWTERDYLVAEYSITGRLGERSRELDFDQMIITNAVILAHTERDYVIAAQEEGRFVLARLLPGGNEPLVRYRTAGDSQRSEIIAVVRALAGRDESLIEATWRAVEKRMSHIEGNSDQGGPAHDGLPASP